MQELCQHRMVVSLPDRFLWLEVCFAGVLSDMHVARSASLYLFVGCWRSITPAMGWNVKQVKK